MLPSLQFTGTTGRVAPTGTSVLYLLTQNASKMERWNDGKMERWRMALFAVEDGDQTFRSTPDWLRRRMAGEASNTPPGQESDTKWQTIGRGPGGFAESRWAVVGIRMTTRVHGDQCAKPREAASGAARAIVFPVQHKSCHQRRGPYLVFLFPLREAI
jgi:hypothetical protein